MERGHGPIGIQAIERMGIKDEDIILDLGCGNGWASRLMAKRASNGEVTGIDISDDMIRIAEKASAGFTNIRYIVSGAEKTPFDAATFDRAFSMESIYYYPEPAAAINEVARVLKRGGIFCVVVDFFAENEPSQFWRNKLNVPVHYLGRADYVQLFESAGFENVETKFLIDPTPLSMEQSFEWFQSRDEYLRFREIGSLFIKGSLGDA